MPNVHLYLKKKKKNLWSIPTLQYMSIIMNECTVDKGKS